MVILDQGNIMISSIWSASSVIAEMRSTDLNYSNAYIDLLANTHENITFLKLSIPCPVVDGSPFDHGARTRHSPILHVHHGARTRDDSSTDMQTRDMFVSVPQAQQRFDEPCRDQNHTRDYSSGNVTLDAIAQLFDHKMAPLHASQWWLTSQLSSFQHDVHTRFQAQDVRMNAIEHQLANSNTA